MGKKSDQVKNTQWTVAKLSILDRGAEVIVIARAELKVVTGKRLQAGELQRRRSRTSRDRSDRLYLREPARNLCIAAGKGDSNVIASPETGWLNPSVLACNAIRLRIQRGCEARFFL